DEKDDVQRRGGRSREASCQDDGNEERGSDRETESAVHSPGILTSGADVGKPWNASPGRIAVRPGDPPAWRPRFRGSPAPWSRCSTPSSAPCRTAERRSSPARNARRPWYGRR